MAAGETRCALSSCSRQNGYTHSRTRHGAPWEATLHVPVPARPSAPARRWMTKLARCPKGSSRWADGELGDTDRGAAHRRRRGARRRSKPRFPALCDYLHTCMHVMLHSAPVCLKLCMMYAFMHACMSVRTNTCVYECMYAACVRMRYT